MRAKVVALAKECNKNFGTGTVVLADEIRPELAPRLTSGSLSIDAALGGGWPTNKWIEIVGPESAGKTALVLKTIAVNQALDPEWLAVWVAAESFDKDWAAMLGVDLKRVIIIDTNVMEEATQMALLWLESQEIDCLVIDSLPALVPDPEADRDMDESLPAIGARVMNKFFRKAHKATRRSLVEQQRPVLSMIINQWRDKIGVMYGESRTTPGGQQKNYEFFVRIEVRRGDVLYDDERKMRSRKRSSKQDTTKPLPIGQEIQIVTFKNKTAPRGRVGLIDFYFDDGVERGYKQFAGEYDEARDVFNAGRIFGVIRHVGGGRYEIDGLNDEWKGLQELERSIRADSEIVDHLRDVVFDVITRSQRHKDTAPQVTSDTEPAPEKRKRRARAT